MGRVKVVPVEQETPVDIPSDVAEPSVKEEPSEPSEPVAEQLQQGVLQSRTEPLAIEAPVVEEAKPATKKEQTMITCEKCGKSMLMKTFKDSHSNVCKPLVPEPPPPPPPPPPTPEPKAKAKRAPPKPKPKPGKPVTAKPEFNGEVSFNHFNEAPQHPVSHIDLYRQAREQRQQVRVQRVKSLISQAI
jgi:hypothetical protein